MSEAPSTTPVCYRHPSRETLLSCSRCERPICTSCMNDAVVGHQCPECVKEGRRSQRPARTAFGGSRAGQLGYVTTAIIAVNSIVMIVSAILGGPSAIAGAGWMGLLGSGTPLTEWGSVVGVALFPDGEVHGVVVGEWYRLFTAMFLHFGVVHLLLNMALVAQVGRYLEGQLGPLRFAGLYLLAGLGGNVAAYVFQLPYVQAAGASTATFGLIVAVIVINRRLSLDSSAMTSTLIVNLIFTFTIPYISIAGHLGGLAAGGAAAAALAYARLPRRGVKQAAGLAALLAVIVIAAVVRTSILS